MVTVISESTKKARKQHRCNYCCMSIEIGEEYTRQYNSYEGDTYTWKMHTHCDQIAQKLIDFKECDNGGADCDDFYCAVMDKWSEITGLCTEGVTLKEGLELVRKELGV